MINALSPTDCGGETLLNLALPVTGDRDHKGRPRASLSSSLTPFPHLQLETNNDGIYPIGKIL